LVISIAIVIIGVKMFRKKENSRILSISLISIGTIILCGSIFTGKLSYIIGFSHGFIRAFLR
jgi:uncharacterized membrane protein YgdD (TMEM256/DUF423 family)